MIHTYLALTIALARWVKPEGFSVSVKWGVVSMHGKGFFYTS